MIQCTQCIFTVVVHSVQNTSQLLVVICLDFAHSGINQLANLVRISLVIERLEGALFRNGKGQISFLTLQADAGILLFQFIQRIFIGITQILDEHNRQYIVFIVGCINGIPQSICATHQCIFNILLGRHWLVPPIIFSIRCFVNIRSFSISSRYIHSRFLLNRSICTACC